MMVTAALASLERNSVSAEDPLRTCPSTPLQTEGKRASSLPRSLGRLGKDGVYEMFFQDGLTTTLGRLSVRIDDNCSPMPLGYDGPSPLRHALRAAVGGRTGAARGCAGARASRALARANVGARASRWLTCKVSQRASLPLPTRMDRACSPREAQDLRLPSPEHSLLVARACLRAFASPARGIR